MADSTKQPAPDPGSGSKRTQQKEMPMEIRLVIAFLLMGIVLFTSPYILKTTAPSVAPAPAPAKKQEAAPAKAAEAPGEQSSGTREAEAPAPGQTVAASQEETTVVESDLYRVEFSNRGAVVRHWVLKKYLDNENKQVDLVNPAGAKRVGYPFSLQVKTAGLPVDLNQALYRQSRPDAHTAVFEYSDGRVSARKEFRFRPDSYLLEVRTEVREQGRLLPHLVAWRGGFGDFAVTNALSTQHAVYFDAAENELVNNEAKKAKDGPVTAVGNFTFAGIDDTYFAAVALPAATGSFEIQTWSDNVPFALDDNKEQPHVGVAIGGTGVNQSSLYVGPKDIDILRRVDPRLEQLVDFGWFKVLAKPLFMALNFVNDRYIHNYGWSIVVVTVLINTLLLPLKFSNLKSMKKMSALQPEVKAIQNKYSNLSMRDPKRQMQQQEMMDLYKKHGVNPLGGCVPVLLQIPFFFAFYKVLTVAIEMRGAHWLWVTDLSQPEHLPIRILPLATVGTQFVMQKMTPSTSVDPQQQRIMMLMPLMFIFVFYSVASGLVLYWLTGNVVGIAQQWFFNKLMGPSPTPAAAAPATPPKKKKK